MYYGEYTVSIELLGGIPLCERVEIDKEHYIGK